jgi:hypothetical protein
METPLTEGMLTTVGKPAISGTPTTAGTPTTGIIRKNLPKFHVIKIFSQKW